MPRERIVPLTRKDNFWQAGPTGPCGPCSELYLDRGLEFGSPDELPGDDGERFLEYWNLVFMQYDQEPEGVLTPLPAKNIDTGLGLNRLAAIMQGTTSIFETDQIRPLVTLGEELSGRAYGESLETDRALRILADHTRGMSFLVADGVVPSNEDRGYVLRRLMRRAIVQGRRIGVESPFLPRFAGVVRELMGSAYPELHEQRETIEMWLRTEEEAFNRTLEQGMRLLDDVIARARDAGAEGIGADQAFLLHDTYGFPFDLTLELAAEQGLGVDEQGFEELMDEQRVRARSVGRGGRDDERERIREFAAAAGFPTTFTGYERIEQATAVGAIERSNGRLLLKLVESPFYATGGGQVADAGVVECEDGGCSARVVDVVRVGDDQALVLEPERGELHEGERVVARVDPAHRRPTACNHTATHLLHAALRARVGAHVRQAGSYVGPDKLRFDFTHGQPLTAEELRDVEQQVNDWILANHPVRALETTLDEAKALGAMALFGEKYGDVVRMVEVGDGTWSRELCGGTHVRSTAEIGVFKVTTETSSAANVRRIEAVTGPVAVGMLRHHDRGALRGGGAAADDARQRRRGGRRPRGEAARAREGAQEHVRGDGLGRRRGRRRRRPRARRAGGVRGPEGDAGRGRQAARPARRPLGRRARQRGRRPRRAARARRRRARSSAASRRARSSRPRRRSSAAAAAGATRWRRPAVAIPTSCQRRSRPRAPRSSARWRVARRVEPHAGTEDVRASSRSTTARRAAASPSRTRPARSRRRSSRSCGRTPARASTGCWRRSARTSRSASSSGCRSRSRAPTRPRRPRRGRSPSASRPRSTRPSSSTTSASRRRSRSAGRGPRRRTRAPPRCCSRSWLERRAG